MSNASLTFLPWVRQGAAAAIAATDTPAAVATVAAALTLNGAPVPGVAVKLRGPADVVGIDPNQIVRTDPRPDTRDFEPNCFPSIEFDRPDFPWLFTPTRANAANQLRPWLCLVVVRKQPGVALTTAPDAPTATLTIASPAVPRVELPDLKDSWAWAHAQVAADDASTPALDDALRSHPDHTLSRLVAPRLLAAETDYVACVVPAFEVGRKAGLGLPITDQDLATLAPAWTFSPTGPTLVTLPVYHSWEFRTNVRGDFESLARRLKANVPAGVGTRPIDISQPGFPSAGATIVALPGALVPARTPDGPPPDPISTAFRTNLASLVDVPGQLQVSDPAADPVLAPPLYGRWHAGTGVVQPSDAHWLAQLNLDPRWRVAAALGTRVVQEHQEALMASAWEQAAELRAANQRLRQLQLSLAVGRVLHERHFQGLGEERMLRIAAPAFGRLRAGGASLLARQTGTKLTPGANRAAMRRIGRQRGPLSRRVASKGAPRSPTDTWVARLNEMWTGPTLAAGQTPPPPPAPPAPPPFDYASLPPLGQFTARLFDTQSSYGVFTVAAELAPVTEPPPLLRQNATTEIPDFFRAAARDHIDRFFPPRPVPISPHFILTYQPIASTVLALTDPTVAIPALARAVIAPGDTTLAPTARGVPATGLETVMAAPHFPQPMYEALRDLSQELLVPGLDHVPPETAFVLGTNRPFVEAFMVGLNHEMGRELLWRGFPTDQRGTYFDRFWGTADGTPPDVAPLHAWGTRALGANPGGTLPPDELVLLLRSALLARYPNAVIYLTPALVRPGHAVTDPGALYPDETVPNERMPIFSGALHPDLVFLGFPVSIADAVGTAGGGRGAGHYVVIQEHPTEPRFGIGEGAVPAGASHLVVGPTPPPALDLQGGTWNTTAAQMALVTRRVPVRVAIHASRLVHSA